MMPTINAAEYKGTLIKVYVTPCYSENGDETKCSEGPYTISQDFLKDLNLPANKRRICTIERLTSFSILHEANDYVNEINDKILYTQDLFTSL
jgi:hypothetical protein